MSEPSSHRSIRSARNAEEFELITTQFLKALRGTTSQKVMSRRLGFSSNVYHHWEAGRRAPALTDVMKAASFAERSEPGEKMAQRLQSAPGRCSMITEMTIGQSLSQLSESLCVSRSALSRWRSGDSIPSFPKFLQLVDLCTGRMVEFINMFVDPLDLPSLADDWRYTSEFRVLVNLMPITVPIILALKLDDYRALDAHDDAWLSRRLGISKEELQVALERIDNVGAIEFDGTHYVAHRPSYDLFSAAPDIWDQLGLEAATQGFYAGAMTEEGMKQVRLETQNFLLRLQDIEQSATTDRNQLALASVRIARLDQDIDS